MSTREEMTISRYGRGMCQVCDRSISLKVDGTLRIHGRERDVGRRGTNCQGSNENPKEG